MSGETRSGRLPQASRATVEAVRPDEPRLRRARTVFFGSGSFGVPVLDAAVEAPEVEVVAVVSVPDRPVGRHGTLTPPPVAARARQLGLHVLQPQRLRAPETIEAVARLRPELGILADYGRLVPRAILELPPHGILNLHPSLLPRHRGAAPIPATILAGDRRAGVTLMLMDEGLDSGPILATRAWDLGGAETAPELEARAALEAGSLLREQLAGWLEGSIGARPQGDRDVTMTRPLLRDDGRLDPACPATQLERQVRAYQPWPGSYGDLPLGRLIVWRASVVAGASSGLSPAEGRRDERPASERPESSAPGTIVVDGDGIALVTSEGLLRLDEVQLAGSRRMSGAELRRGRPALVGSRA